MSEYKIAFSIAFYYPMINVSVNQVGLQTTLQRFVHTEKVPK